MTNTIGLICGSLRKNSYNQIIAQSLAGMDGSYQFHWIEVNNLPLFNEDLEIIVPETVIAFKSAIQDVDGIIIVRPEYSSGRTVVLKNVLNWASPKYMKRLILIRKCLLTNKQNGIFSAIYNNL